MDNYQGYEIRVDENLGPYEAVLQTPNGRRYPLKMAKKPKSFYTKKRTKGRPK